MNPPPPPPHGEAPKSSGLPPGKYDIFIIPPHSSGSGFLYLPSMRPNVNSFAAGFATALIMVVVGSALAPAVQAWWNSVKGSGGIGMIMLIFAIAVGAWALGRIQSDGGPGPGGGATGHNAGGHSGPFPGAHAGARPGPHSNGYAGGHPSGAPPPPPPHSGPTPGPTPGQRQHAGPTPDSQYSRPSPEPQYSRPPPEPQYSKSPPEPQYTKPPPEPQYSRPPPEPQPKSGPPPGTESEPPPKPTWQRSTPTPGPTPKPSTPSSSTKTAWEKAREETKRKEDERKAKEAEKKRREDLEKRLKELREKEAREREAREKKRKDEEELEKARKQAEEEKQKAAKRAEEEKEKAAKLAEEEKEKVKKRAEQRVKELAAAKIRLAERAAAAAKERAAKEKAAQEAIAKEAAAKEAAAKKAAEEAASKPPPSTYAFSSVGERLNPWPKGRPVSPTPAPKPRSQPPPPTVSPKKPPPPPSARTYLDPDEDAYSYRPYDKPKKPTHTKSPSSIYSETSYAASNSTSKTTPPPSHRGPYSTKDPDKIVIKAVYSFNNAFLKTPTSQLVSGVGSVTDGLILRITTEGLFIDDDVRGVPQREWDVKAWTMKLVEVWCPAFRQNPAGNFASARVASTPKSSNPVRRLWGLDKDKVATSEETDALLVDMLHLCKNNCRVPAPAAPRSYATSSVYSASSAASSAFDDRSDSAYGSSVGSSSPRDNLRTNKHGVASQTGELKTARLHVLRASIRDQEGKRYVFVITEEESWKVAVGLQRLRKGTQVRALGVSGMTTNDARGTLENLGWA